VQNDAGLGALDHDVFFKYSVAVWDLGLKSLVVDSVAVWASQLASPPRAAVLLEPDQAPEHGPACGRGSSAADAVLPLERL
jgi:hypothetical protein